MTKHQRLALELERHFPVHQRVTQKQVEQWDLKVLVTRRLGLVVATAWWRVDGSRAELQSLAVDPAHQRAGHGRRLLRRLYIAAKRLGLRQVYLDVVEDNIPARRLYEGEGFLTITRVGRKIRMVRYV